MKVPGQGIDVGIMGPRVPIVNKVSLNCWSGRRRPGRSVEVYQRLSRASFTPKPIRAAPLTGRGAQYGQGPRPGSQLKGQDSPDETGGVLFIKHLADQPVKGFRREGSDGG
jgi:hypothetical protein